MLSGVLILGNPILRETCETVHGFQNEEIIQNIMDLKQALNDFRKEHGFGRGIAAIQIGIKRRIIALNLGKETSVIINPNIVWRSQESFTLWDDCMSFPDLVVKVKRSSSISVEYQDDQGIRHVMEKLGRAESELLQHEIDHLDGILAIDRAMDFKDIIYKSEYNKHHKFYNDQVDCSIIPTAD